MQAGLFVSIMKREGRVAVGAREGVTRRRRREKCEASLFLSHGQFSLYFPSPNEDIEHNSKYEMSETDSKRK